MGISEQVKELRELAEPYKANFYEDIFRKAADTIESLFAKLQAANEELERWHTDFHSYLP